jgi:hypothetical protein
MKRQLTDRFVRSFRTAPPEVRKAFDKQCRLLGSYPKSAMPPEALWMFEFAGQRGFGESAQDRVIAPGKPGNVVGAGRSDPASGTGSVPGSLESREIGHAEKGVGQSNGGTRDHGQPAVLWRSRKSLMGNRLFAVTFLG